MNTITSNKSIEQIKGSDVESVQCDLSVSMTYILAAENFIDEVRDAIQLFDTLSENAKSLLINGLSKAQTMMSETHIRLQEADLAVTKIAKNAYDIERAT